MAARIVNTSLSVCSTPRGVNGRGTSKTVNATRPIIACSTPRGVNGRGTSSGSRYAANPLCAQRLGALTEGEPLKPPRLEANGIGCSTPRGVNGRGTRRGKRGCICGVMCSTPRGVNGRGTLDRKRRATATEGCSTPRGVNGRGTSCSAARPLRRTRAQRLGALTEGEHYAEHGRPLPGEVLNA